MIKKFITLETDYCPTETWDVIPFDSLDILLPKQPGVYAIFDGDNKPIYVGESKELNTRWRSHSNWFPCLREGAETCRYVTTKRHKELEKHIVIAIQPRLNKCFNTEAFHTIYYDTYGYIPFIYRDKEWRL